MKRDDVMKGQAFARVDTATDDTPGRRRSSPLQQQLIALALEVALDAVIDEADGVCLVVAWKDGSTGIGATLNKDTADGGAMYRLLTDGLVHYHRWTDAWLERAQKALRGNS